MSVEFISKTFTCYDSEGRAVGSMTVEYIDPQEQEDARVCEEPPDSAEELSGADLMDLDPEDPHQLGRLGETIAANYLHAIGYEVVERNWRTPFGEVDIVAFDPDEEETVLIEVKTRHGSEADPSESVNAKKVERYRKQVLYYLIEHEHERARFDVIALNVQRRGVARLRHIAGAYDWDY